jgi:hypothetical protein
MVAFNASAGRITLNNPESQPLPKGELLCIYTSSVAGTFTFITKSKNALRSKPSIFRKLNESHQYIQHTNYLKCSFIFRKNHFL